MYLIIYLDNFGFSKTSLMIFMKILGVLGDLSIYLLKFQPVKKDFVQFRPLHTFKASQKAYIFIPELLKIKQT